MKRLGQAEFRPEFRSQRAIGELVSVIDQKIFRRATLHKHFMKKKKKKNE